ncbi:MAG: hypothetical protein OET79_12500 [Nitrospirota bacterium]|nr:hypothetical protein [Nitrospirota bacterium]
MALKTIRLELARNPDFPSGSTAHGYEFVAPLDEDGHLDMLAWREHRAACVVRRFWVGDDDQHGRLIHHRGHHWAFHYDDAAEDDEPIFRFDQHRFVRNDYVSITEHDGIQRTFRVADIR